jgi:hypothetical protein
VVTATVIYVHGNGNKVRKELLKAEWDQALFGKDMGTRSVMAYWAPLRYPQPLVDAAFDEIEQPAAADLPAGEVSAAALGVSPVDLQTEALTEARTELGAEAAAEGLVDDSTALDQWLQKLAYQADALAEGESAEALMPGVEALPLPRAARVAIFRALVKVSFKDVYAYFFGGFGEAMRGVIRDAIAPTDGPVFLVSHSLGTIIAYDLLREADGLGRDIPLFVTAGSPLGVQEIQDLVAHPLRVPAGVAAWRNVCDARDLVALDSTIRPEYDPASRCSDFIVTNDSANHHGIREYLSAPLIRDAVAPHFG